jgi:carboxypeptidase C (cathepsin A)
MLLDYGPFKLSVKDQELIKNEGASILDFADFLVPDLPAGSGFSLTDEFPTSNKQAVRQSIKFFQRLSKSRQLKRNGIKLKKRPVVLWGVSYGGGYLP